MNKAEKDDAAVVAFITAICPEAPELYMAAFDEMQAIRDATKLIGELKAEVARLKADAELRENGYTFSQTETIDRGASQEATINRGSFAKYADWESDDE